MIEWGGTQQSTRAGCGNRTEERVRTGGGETTRHGNDGGNGDGNNDDDDVNFGNIGDGDGSRG